MWECSGYFRVQRGAGDCDMSCLAAYPVTARDTGLSDDSAPPPPDDYTGACVVDLEQAFDGIPHKLAAIGPKLSRRVEDKAYHDLS